MRIGYAGDREIAVSVLDFLLKQGVRPMALCLSESSRATHAKQLTELCGHLSPADIFSGVNFRNPEGIKRLKDLDLDYIISVHFPYLIPKTLLQVPRYGTLNLHPAYLPFNRGYHTPSWAILEGTPYGATLHFMDEEIDTGDIVYRKQLDISPADTANTLYQKVRCLELEVFKEAWPEIVNKSYVRLPQKDLESGSLHRRNDLLASEIQKIDLDVTVKTEDMIKRLRALTTNNWDEAAYFESEGARYRVQIAIQKEVVLRNKV